MTRFREPINGILHFGALLVSLLGTGYLLGLSAQQPLKQLTLGIYGLCMSLTFLASTAHHLIHGPRRLEEWFLKLDHAAIFLFIAGTYTPVTMHLLPVTARWPVLGIVWTIAVLGVLYKLIVFKVPEDLSTPPDRLSTLAYVLMGWVIVFQAPALLQSLSGTGLILGLLGGMFYTVGGIILTTQSFDFAPGLLGHHEIWHLFVIGGTVCLYLLICWDVVPSTLAHLAPALA
jgi:hemolysin III